MSEEIQKKDGKFFVDNYEVMDGIGSEGWWDGPTRYKKVNRNIITWVQHDTLFNLISRMSGKIGVDIGGPSGSPQIDGLMYFNLHFAPEMKKNCIRGRAEQLPFKTGSLDFIISAHTLEHIRDTENTLREWLRVLKVGALMAVVLPDKRHFLHDPAVIKDGETAYSEMAPDDLRQVINRIQGIQLLSLNTFDNNFDFEMVIRKCE